MSEEERAFASATAVGERSGEGVGDAVPLQEIVGGMAERCEDDCSCSDETSSFSGGGGTESEGIAFGGLILSKSGLVLNKPKGSCTPQETSRGIDLDHGGGEEEEEFYDPITMDEFKDPVVTPCGHVFSAGSIMDWLGTGNNTCPLCRTVVTNSTLKPAHELRLKLGLDDVDTSDEDFRKLINVINADSSSDADQHDMGLYDFGHGQAHEEEEEVPCCAKVLIVCCAVCCRLIIFVLVLIAFTIAFFTLPFWFIPCVFLLLVCILIAQDQQQQQQGQL